MKQNQILFKSNLIIIINKLCVILITSVKIFVSFKISVNKVRNVQTKKYVMLLMPKTENTCSELLFYSHNRWPTTTIKSTVDDDLYNQITYLIRFSSSHNFGGKWFYIERLNVSHTTIEICLKMSWRWNERYSLKITNKYFWYYISIDQGWIA